MKNFILILKKVSIYSKIIVKYTLWNTKEIIKSDYENNLIFIKGSVPGSKNSIVLIQKTSKKINRSTTLERFTKPQAEQAKAGAKKETPKKDKAKDTEKPKAEKTKTENFLLEIAISEKTLR